jgi:hypothetical protein
MMLSPSDLGTCRVFPALSFGSAGIFLSIEWSA